MICNISSSIHLKPSPVIQFNPRQASSPFTIKFPHHHTSLRLPSHHCRNLAKYCTQSTHSATDVSSSTEEVFDAELDRLLSLLPEQMRARVLEHPELSGLVEVVLDLGRPPLARFPSGDFVLSDSAITLQDLQFAASQVGDFAVDNRAGISRTLHRISAIRNRKGEIIGLTCRVGRAIHGSASLLRDLVQDGASILLIGPPGVGKTTIIREIARMLANDYQKRVMIVDTSNEIGGDGDIPHSGIGNARRMQVGNSEMQHKVLIEAVENHMPQVIVIDEIGTKLEAMAASTIAQRGIQLVATAHGVTIENLIMNPSLDMLIGGIQSVTLGDDEASRRGVQKTVLERKGPSTFGCGVEIISKTELRVHRYLESTVDAVLAGRSPVVDVRKMRLQVSNGATEVEPYADTSVRNEQDTSLGGQGLMDERLNVSEFTIESPLSTSDLSLEVQPFHLYVYGILEASVIQVINQLEVPVQLTYNISEADGLLALQSKIKRNLKIQAAAESHNIPIYVTKTSSLVQVTKAIKALINDRDADGSKDFISDNDGKSSEKMDALEETRIAIEEVVIPKGEPVELLPRQSHIIPLQMNFIQGYKLQSEIIGTGPEARLRILPYTTQNDNAKSNNGNADDDYDDYLPAANGETNGSIYTVDKLPFLPDSS
ncbi:Protein SEEDLING PLASTID DEVELOPMENT 1 [Linum perenne]